jgi:hypothetical protein
VDDLSIHMVGAAADDGTLPLAELARIAGGFQASLDRLSLAIQGRAVGPGRRSAEIVGAVQLAITALESGSVTLCLTRTGQGVIDGDRIFDSTLSALAGGIRGITENPDHLPEYFTAPLVNGLRDLAGGVGPGKLTRIEIVRSGRVLCSIDDAFRRAVTQLEISCETTDATIVGRLHMGDFSPASLRCRVDSYAGSILCDFDAELKDTVLDAMDRMVMVSGTAQLQPDGSTIRTLHMTALEALHSARSRSLGELAAAQGIGVLTSADELAGESIPDEDFQRFLHAVDSARSDEA